MKNEVEAFYNRQLELINYLTESSNISFAQDAREMLQKNLPLAAASYFEHRITNILEEFVNKKSNKCNELINLFNQKAIKRQYHTFFDWEKNNTNKFLSLFGEDFKNNVSKKISNSDMLSKSSRDFLSIGNMRNLIIHNNYSKYNTDQTTEEIFELFNSADKYIVFIEAELMSI